MDVRYINPFIEAMRLAFSTMVHANLTIGRPTIRASARQFSDRNTISIQIQLAGGNRGCVVLRFPAAVAVELIAGFAGERPRKLDAAAIDALAEIANVVVGNAKRNMPGGLTSISPPTVLPDGASPFSGNARVLSVPVSSTVGAFWLEAQLEPGEPLADEGFMTVIESPVLDHAEVDSMVKELIAAAT